MKNAWKNLSTSGKAGFILVALVAVIAVISLLWTPYHPDVADPAARLSGPSGEHLLGTDRFGRDTLSRLLVGAQITLFVGVIAVGIAAIIGVPLGIAAGMRRGTWLDALIVRGADLLLAFPALLLAIIAGAIWGPSTLTAMIAIGIAGIPSFARVARSGTLQIVTQDYVAAARVSRVSNLRISLRHILPNISSLLIVQASVYFALAVLAEAALSYLGLGTAPPTASWGRMLQDSQSLLGVAPMQAFWPGLSIGLTVLGFNLLGDGIRDLLDPRLKGEKR
ncbi:ABC transporter permease [Corynebacterium camporealensis]